MIQRRRATNDGNVPWLDGFPSHWRVVPSKRLFAEQKTRALDGDVQRTASQAYGVIPQKEYIERSGQRVVQVNLHLEQRKHVERDDFVMSMRSFEGGLERAWSSGCIRSSYVVLRPACVVHVGFFARLFKSRAYILALQVTSHFIRDGQDLNFDNFCLVDLPLPPMGEQEAIAAFLDRKIAAIDALIAKKERLVELLQEKRQALITQAVTKGLDPSVPMKDSGVDWLGRTPSHWAVTRVGFLCQIGNGSTPSREDPGFWLDGEIGWLNSGKINDGVVEGADQFVTRRAVAECHLPRVEAGSVLVAITGEGQTRGRAALLVVPATISQHLAFLTPRSSALEPAYLWRQLQARYDWLRFESDGTTGSTKAALTCQFLRTVPLALPPVAEQRSICSEIDSSLAQDGRLLKTTTDSIERLHEYRQALITAAVTGKINVLADQTPEVSSIAEGP